MSNLPEALRLADVLTEEGESWWDDAAAAELRRLYELHELYQDKVARLNDALNRANGMAEHFERQWYLSGDQIDRLLEALHEIAEWTERYTTPGHPISTVARAAIEQAHGITSGEATLGEKK